MIRVGWRWFSAVVIIAALGTPLAADVVINELLASNSLTNTDEDGNSSDWLELYNAGAEAAQLEGYSLTDDPTVPRMWLLPEMMLAPGAHALVWCSGKDRTELPAELITERNSPVPLAASQISLADDWRYLAAPPETAGPSADWHSPEFDDAAWPVGKPGFGYGDDELVTTVPDGAGALFLRRKFVLPEGQRNLILQMRYDDGFVAYIDGVRVASDNFPEGEDPTFASLASTSNSARNVERFDLTLLLDTLVPGEHVLGLVVMNRSATNRDLILYPELGTVPAVMHTNFKLSSSGDRVLLVDPAGEVADRVDLPEQYADQSWGRTPDGAASFLYYRTPTPLAPNEGPATAQPMLVADTKFSQDRGYYTDPFEVEITTETADAEIRYTLDGTEPTDSNGEVYAGAIVVAGTTTLRARAFKEGFEPTDVDTHTYIFLEEVVGQRAQNVVARGFPTNWNGTRADYDMDSDVIGPGDRFGGAYAETIRDDLLSLPVMSIVLDIQDMFGPQGIYSNPTAGGLAWERPCSVEYFSAEEDSGEFNVNCGVRIQGGWFRSASATPKHSLRLLFKREYGPTKLRFPLFGEDVMDSFDTITLRAGANDGYSWDAARLTEQYTRDEFGRTLQRATGNAGAPGTFVHLYINGVYWGLYNPVVRPDHSFSAYQYGGEKEDWDAVHDLAATNGDTAAWTEMVSAAGRARTAVAEFFALQGRSPDGSPDPELPHLLDVPNYIDYLLVNVWGGNWDWPWKNWWAGRDRTENSTGFKFYCWDFENTMGNNRGRSPLNKNALQNNFSSAGVPHQSLRTNPEYRLLFGDRAHRLLFGDGPLTPGMLGARYAVIADTIERAIVCESARWGDQHHNPPLSLREWETERNWIEGAYLPQRSNIVLQQLRAASLYPAIDAPVFDRPAGLVEAGAVVLPRVLEGTVYYTDDGSDPRLPGGEVSRAARIADTGERVVLVAEAALARFAVPADDSLGLDWTAPEFDDSTWSAGETAIGYERSSGYEEYLATDVHDLMYEINTSVYLRIAFDVGDVSELTFLTLGMRYDDGFVAYINGERVAERNVPDELAWDSEAARSHADSAATQFELIPLGIPSEVLTPGRNVLAIHALNRRTTDSDFLIEPQLTATDATGAGIVISQTVYLRSRTWVDGDWSAIVESPFVVDTDIPLRVTEVMYHPHADEADGPYDADEYEFVEIRNVGGAAIDLSGIQLRGGIDFHFGDSGIEVLAAGDHVLVVENIKAFHARYGTSQDERIAGEYSGKLGNAGDELVLEGYLGEPILSFTYDDEWHPETDGDGMSLVIVDPYAPRASWNDGASWMPSAAIGGSPGTDESGVEPGGFQLPGDIDQDGRRNITDAVVVLQTLFGGLELPMPCEGGSITEGSNLAVYDLDGDRSVNLTDAVALLNYLFGDGDPPALGRDCVRIRGCPDVCVDSIAD